MGIGARVAALRQAAASPERGVAHEKAAARLVDGAGMGREYKVMGVTGGIGGGTGEVWPFIAGEAQDTPKEESVDRPSLSEGAQARL
jgi:hypothetical protein